jgi:hypothetical protein
LGHVGAIHSVNLRQLRDTKQLKAGETGDLRER